MKGFLCGVLHKKINVSINLNHILNQGEVFIVLGNKCVFWKLASSFEMFM